MPIVRWNEDKEGCLVAAWFDDENAERGGFVVYGRETVGTRQHPAARTGFPSTRVTALFFSEAASGTADARVGRAGSSPTSPILGGEHS